VDEYFLSGWNATEAARRAGYKANSRHTFEVIGWENLRKPEIAAAITERIQARAMSADEVLDRLAQIARGDMDDFITGEAIDLNKARLARKMHLVKKFSRTDGEQATTISLELYNAQQALVDLGRHLKLFTDKLEMGGDITVSYVNDWRNKSAE
jgi:phage terminase small subunit